VISISAGQRGLQILVGPDDYIRVVDAKVAPIAKEKEQPDGRRMKLNSSGGSKSVETRMNPDRSGGVSPATEAQPWTPATC
jgi:hypothetical protein